MKVLHVTPEVVPLSKTGGLADVSAALPRALRDLGVAAVVVTPDYGDAARAGRGEPPALARRLRKVPVRLGAWQTEVGVREGTLPGGRVPVWVVEHELFVRPHPYGEGNRDYPDNPRRFALLARAALALDETLGLRADVVHAHDWQAALAPHWLRREGGRARAVLTVHNLAFLGLAPKAVVEELDLGWDGFHPDGFEFYDQVSTLKAGIAACDRLTTVSRRYAQEIQTEPFGSGLHGFLRRHAGKLTGIANGIDTATWNPRVDPFLPARFSADALEGKAACKEELQRQARLPRRARTPVFAVISRLTDQKGTDLVTAAIADLLPHADLQLVVLGSGDPAMEARVRDLAARFPDRVALRTSFDDPFAHLIEAGGDFFLMPSRYEPCGLSQMYSMAYGTVPIVTAVGGLDDTVVDYDPGTRTGSGFKLAEPSAERLAAAIRRALALFSDGDALGDLRRRIMRLDFSWGASARRYLELYEGVLR